MAMYTSLHMDPEEETEITCTHQLNSLKPEGYPVLSVGTLSIYPTRERLERLVAVCAAYLAAHGDKAEGFQVGYPSDVRCDHCGSFTIAFKGHLRCFGCGNSMSLPPDGPADEADVVPAEVATDDAPYIPCPNPACGGELRVATGLWHCAACDGLFPEDEVEDAHMLRDHMGGDCRVLRARMRRDP